MSHFLDGLGLQMKPVGPSCNIACDYCYVEPFKGKMEKMSHEVLECSILSLLKNSGHPTISWHGGEPMLAGLAFYESAQSIIRASGYPNKSVRNQIQTNATLITPEFAQFFKDSNFGVGISIDGPEYVHSKHRVDHSGKSSFNRTIAGLQQLLEAGVEPWVISTVTKDNLAYPKESFKFLVGLGFTDIRFTPVFEAGSGKFGILPDEWGAYLISIFDLWFELGNPNVHIRELEQIMTWLLGGKIPLCSGNHGCLNWISVNPLGELYPCEYFKGRFSYGNILSMDLSEVEDTIEFSNYKEAFVTSPPECLGCKYVGLCGNGCSATRVKDGEMNPAGVDFYCPSKKLVFEHIVDVFSPHLGNLEGG